MPRQKESDPKTMKMAKLVKPVKLAGSDPVRPRDVHRAKTPHPRALKHITVVVRSKASDAEIQAAVAKLARQMPAKRRHLTLREFDEQYAAREEDIRRVAGFYEGMGLRIVETDPRRRAVALAGTFKELERAFDTELSYYDHDGTSFRSHVGPLNVPRELAGTIEGVLGLDNRAINTRHLAMATRPAERSTIPHLVSGAYNFPEHEHARGQTIAILCLSGGFHRSDIARFFTQHGLVPPRVSVVNVFNARNRPVWRKDVAEFGKKFASGNMKGLQAMPNARDILWTIEATMDVELAGTFAPGAHIVVYFASNTERGRFAAFTRAMADGKHRPSVFSCSWGAEEKDIPVQVLRVMDKTYQLAALLGITICASSGDSGRTGVNFPASSPHVLGCGGTHLHLSSDGKYESVWNEDLGELAMSTSGGFSNAFERPSWQPASLGGRKTGRGVPDVAAKADLATGYEILAGGCPISMGGTSAAAPLWAGLIARMNQALKTRVGFLTPLLYGRGFASALHDITVGNNGRYKAMPGWDPCTGHGTPDGKGLLAALGWKGKADSAKEKRKAKSPARGRGKRRAIGARSQA
jgi:kumamolisin